MMRPSRWKQPPQGLDADAREGPTARQRHQGRCLAAALALLAALTTACTTLQKSPRNEPAVLQPRSSQAFRDILAQGNSPVLAVFVTDTCTACHSLDAELESLRLRYGRRLTIVKANLAYMGGLINDYMLTKVPTAIFFAPGHRAGVPHNGRVSAADLGPFLDGELSRKTP